MHRPGLRDAYVALKLYELRARGGLRRSCEMVGDLTSCSFDEIRPLLDHAHPKNADLRQAVGYWEIAASFVIRGILHPDVYLDTCDDGLSCFAVLEEHLPRIREIRPHFLAKTEAIIQEHPRVKGRLMEVRARIFRTRDQRAADAGD